jgi:hypothetical protein
MSQKLQVSKRGGEESLTQVSIVEDSSVKEKGQVGSGSEKVMKGRMGREIKKDGGV